MRGYLVRTDAHTIAVERMRLGDHAFAHYADDDVRWEVPAVFAFLGLSRGEKVIVMMDPGCSADDACERLPGFGDGGADDARDRGQLVFSSMRELISPEKSFTPSRELDRLRQETELACREGFAGLRAVIDMAWVDELGTDIEGVMAREKHADSLFESRRSAEICTSDRRWFDPAVVEEMWRSHPVALLERPGDLQAHHAPGELYLIGDADMATGDIFRAAVSVAFEAPPAGAVSSKPGPSSDTWQRTEPSTRDSSRLPPPPPCRIALHASSYTARTSSSHLFSSSPAAAASPTRNRSLGRSAAVKRIWSGAPPVTCCLPSPPGPGRRSTSPASDGGSSPGEGGSGLRPSRGALP